MPEVQCSVDRDIDVRSMFNSDPKLLDDLKNHRLHDSYKLIKRLENVKTQFNSKKIEDFPDGVNSLLQSLVTVYMETADSIKVSRAVEKLWQPYMANHSETILAAIESHVLKIIQQQDPDQPTTAKISVLFEQNKTAQQVVRQNLDQVTTWIGKHVSALTQLSPLDLSQTQAQRLYCFVKMSLQLFQICPLDLGPVIWNREPVNQASGDIDVRQASVKQIVESLVHILSIKGYHVDCVLLSGTATALVLNTAPTIPSQIHAFNVLLNSTLNHSNRFHFDQLFGVNVYQDASIVKEKLGHISIEQMGPVALLRGTIVCAGTDFLCYHWQQCGDKVVNHTSDKKQMEYNSDLVTVYNFYQLFTYVQKLCQSDITLHYHAFQILLLWYTRLNKIISTLENSVVNDYAPSLLESTLDLALLNWDSPVEDVPEAVVDIFSHMMTLWQKVKDKEPEFCKNILEVLVKTEWHVKGKYRILAALLKYLDSKQLLQVCTGIQPQLLQCLSTNHLAPSASAVYRAFLKEIKGDNTTNGVEKWRAPWLDVIVSGLVSSNSLLCHNTSLHWVPATLKLIPNSGSCLLEHLSALLNKQDTSLCHTRHLHAWVTVANTIRSLTGSVDLTDVHIGEALYSPDEDIRSEAISLVCTTLKKADCLSDTESQLLRGSLPYNIKIDSAPFRQHLCSSLRKLLVRLRDSCITMLKAVTENKPKLDRALDFVDWLHSLCLEYLLPGACYQRRKGSLDMLVVLYESLVYCPDTKQRKGFTPETTVKLVDFAVSTGRWLFFCRENLDTLILCLLDGADEIRSLAFHLLTRYYTMPQEGDQTGNQWGPDSLCCPLMTAGVQLCCSPKGHESQSGAILCQLVFQKYVIQQGVGIRLTVGDDGGQYQVLPYMDCPDAPQHFLTSLLTEIQHSLAEAKTNLVLASKKYPVHGLVSALCLCMTRSEGLWSAACQDTVSLLQQFITTCQAIIDQMLAVMAGVAGQEACPSFAEIGMALESLLQENQPEYTEGTALSPEYQYMLSWCWNNIKESCVSLGDVMQTMVTHRLCLPPDTISSMGSTFLTVLTKCRHKGVIEGCRGAFVQFCSALFQSEAEHLQRVPADTLSQVLSSLMSKAMKSSVTRRSAGLPIIIQAVLTSEKKTKKRTLLTLSVSALFQICELPLDDDYGVTDLPQVHGLNILNSLFCDASLTASLMGHVSRAVILVIQQFGSPSWAIRNAATRFFSTLVTRIFGQKKTSSDEDGMLCNSVTFQEFSSYYPELPPFLLEVLKRASRQDIADIGQIDPSLFPVLTLLSFLKPVDKDSETIGRMLAELADHIRLFVSSPVYQLRHLVAPAYVAMVNMADIMPTALSIIKQFISCDSGDKSITLNCIHGNLLVINRLLDNITECEDLELLWATLMERAWLIQASHGMVSGQYVRILYRTSQKKPSLTLPCHLAADLLHSCCSASMKVGDGVFYTEAVQLLFHAAQHGTITEAGVLHKLEATLLQSQSLETRKACLLKLQAQIETSNTQKREILMSVLCSSLKPEDYTPNLCLMLNMINFLYLESFTMPPTDIDHLKEWFQQCYPVSSKCISVNAAALPVQGILIKQIVQNNERGSNSTEIRSWCGLVRSSSQVTNETQRHAAAQALCVIGDSVFQVPMVTDGDIAESAVSLISASLTLIQDEDTDIRAEACKFVSDLNWSGRYIQYPSVHSNVCFELFLRYLSDNLWQCEACVRYLSDMLYQPGNLATVYTDKITTRFQQLFDQEDNSFFAERLYNAVSYHQTLKGMITQIKACGGQTITAMLDNRAVLADLAVLKEILTTITKGSLINICSDNVILASIVSLILMTDLVTMVTDDKEQQQIQTKLNRLLLEQYLPPLAVRMIRQNCSLI